MKNIALITFFLISSFGMAQSIECVTYLEDESSVIHHLTQPRVLTPIEEKNLIEEMVSVRDQPRFSERLNEIKQTLLIHNMRLIAKISRAFKVYYTRVPRLDLIKKGS